MTSQIFFRFIRQLCFLYLFLIIRKFCYRVIINQVISNIEMCLPRITDILLKIFSLFCLWEFIIRIPFDIIVLIIRSRRVFCLNRFGYQLRSQQQNEPSSIHLVCFLHLNSFILINHSYAVSAGASADS